MTTNEPQATLQVFSSVLSAMSNFSKDDSLAHYEFIKLHQVCICINRWPLFGLVPAQCLVFVFRVNSFLQLLKTWLSVKVHPEGWTYNSLEQSGFQSVKFPEYNTEEILKEKPECNGGRRSGTRNPRWMELDRWRFRGDRSVDSSNEESSSRF